MPVWSSPSGDSLNFEVGAVSSNWNPVAGIYMMCGRDVDGSWRPFYIGQADSLRDRLGSHEQWPDAVQLGATHIHATVIGAKPERDRVEKLLIAHFNPPLNVQHRQPSLGVIGGLWR